MLSAQWAESAVGIEEPIGQLFGDSVAPIYGRDLEVIEDFGTANLRRAAIGGTFVRNGPVLASVNLFIWDENNFGRCRFFFQSLFCCSTRSPAGEIGL